MTSPPHKQALFSRGVDCLRHQSARSITLLAAFIVLVVGLLDYWTGAEFGVSILYLGVVCPVGWWVGKRLGLLVAAMAGVTWLVAELASHVLYENSLAPYWNALMRFGIFAIGTILAAELSLRKRSLEEKTVELARTNDALIDEVAERKQIEVQLRVLNENLEKRVAERSAAAEQRAQALTLSEASVRSQKTLLQSILDSMGDAVLVADARGRIVRYNPEAERLLGVQFADVSLAEWLAHQSFFSPDRVTVYPSDENVFLRTLRGDAVDGVEMMHRPSGSGPALCLGITGRPVRDEAGQITGAVLVFRDITARKQLEEQITEVSEREQRRIGQDIHDGLCQHLVGTGLAASMLQKRLEGQRVAEAKDAGELVDAVQEAISQARGLARGLYPVRLEAEGLMSALEEMAASVQSVTGISCRVESEGRVLLTDRAASSSLYRIAQEAVNNALKHARPKQIIIAIDAVEDEITLTVTDDGTGFVLEGGGHMGMGVHIMNYRARMIGASFDIRRGARGGTTVICSFRNPPASGMNAAGLRNQEAQL